MMPNSTYLRDLMAVMLLLAVAVGLHLMGTSLLHVEINQGICPFHVGTYKYIEILHNLTLKLLVQEVKVNYKNSASAIIILPVLEYSDVASRLATFTDPDFQNWDQYATVLAECGFYFDQGRKLLVCYSCGNVLTKDDLMADLVSWHDHDCSHAAGSPSERVQETPHATTPHLRLNASNLSHILGGQPSPDNGLLGLDYSLIRFPQRHTQVPVEETAEPEPIPPLRYHASFTFVPHSPVPQLFPLLEGANTSTVEDFATHDVPGQRDRTGHVTPGSSNETGLSEATGGEPTVYTNGDRDCVD